MYWASAWHERPIATNLKDAYGEFKAEATAVFPDYQVRSVCTDGFQATREAWRRLFPHLTLVLCFLHSILKTQRALPGGSAPPRVGSGLARVSGGDQRAVLPTPTAHGRVGQYHPRRLAGAEMVPRWRTTGRTSRPPMTVRQAARTTNAVDRLHNHLDRVLYAMRYCHGQRASARLAVRAWALQWNFHPYGSRLRHDQPSRSSPFADLNGFHYHPNWLHNFLIASSMGGLRL